MEYLINWVINLPLAFSTFLAWLTTPLPYINISPLSIFSLGGISLLVGFLLLRLVIGGQIYVRSMAYTIITMVWTSTNSVFIGGLNHHLISKGLKL